MLKVAQVSTSLSLNMNVLVALLLPSVLSIKESESTNLNNLQAELSTSWDRWIIWTERKGQIDWNKLFHVNAKADKVNWWGADGFAQATVELARESHELNKRFNRVMSKVISFFKKSKSDQERVQNGLGYLQTQFQETNYTIHWLSESILVCGEQNRSILQLNDNVGDLRSDVKSMGKILTLALQIYKTNLNSTQELDQIKKSFIDMDDRFNNFSSEVKKILIIGISVMSTIISTVMAIGFTILSRNNKKMGIKDPVQEKPGADKTASLAMNEMWDHTYDYVDPPRKDSKERINNDK